VQVVLQGRARIMALWLRHYPPRRPQLSNDIYRGRPIRMTTPARFRVSREIAIFGHGTGLDDDEPAAHRREHIRERGVIARDTSGSSIPRDKETQYRVYRQDRASVRSTSSRASATSPLSRDPIFLCRSFYGNL